MKSKMVAQFSSNYHLSSLGINTYVPDQRSIHFHSRSVNCGMPWQRVLASVRAALRAQHGDKGKGELY